MFSYNKIEFGDFFIQESILKKIFTSIEKIVKKEQSGVINLVFLDDDSIQNLNNQYRQKNKTTDVLSFHYFDEFIGFSDTDIVGEIVFSKQKIISQGQEYGLGEEKEFYKLLIHSILHILGYDHEIDEEYIVMNDLEKKVWQEVFGEV